MAANIFKFVIFLLVCHEANCAYVLKKAVCTLIDEKFAKFDLCEVKPNPKKIPALSIYIRILQLPVTNYRTHLEIIYMPSRKSIALVNSTWDSCAFMENRKKFRAFDRFVSAIIDYSNLNHTCPYTHDVIISNLVIDIPALTLALPRGDYLVKTAHLIDDDNKFTIDLTGKVV